VVKIQHILPRANWD